MCCATTRMLLESAKRAFLSKGVARLAKRGDRGKLTNIEQHKDKQPQPQPRPIDYDPKKTTSCGGFLVRFLVLVGASRGRTGPFFRLPGRGGCLGGPSTKWGGPGRPAGVRLAERTTSFDIRHNPTFDCKPIVLCIRQYVAASRFGGDIACGWIWDRK